MLPLSVIASLPIYEKIMYANKVKKIAAVHDLSGAGRVSLTVVIPILSSMGFQVCPLPTAVLSSHTQFPHFSFLDLTDEMPKIIAEWKKLEVQFDAIYTGYLAHPDKSKSYRDLSMTSADRTVSSLLTPCWVTMANYIPTSTKR